MISVIVPVYNVEKYLTTCIESVLHQDYSDFELLLVDDGSTDSSGAICDMYAAQDSRIRCFHRENSGVGNARNFGIDQAKGEWLCFIDSDDGVYSNYLSGFDTNNTRADIVITGIDFVNIQTSAIIRRDQYSLAAINLETDRMALIPILPIGFPVGKAYRRELLITNGLRFPTDISFHEDHVFVFDCYLHSKIIEVKSDVTYIYRIDYSNQSLSKKKHPWQKHWAASNYMFDRLFKIKESFGYNEDDLRHIYTFAYEPVISAVYDLYNIDCPRHERMTVLRELIKGKLPIDRLYYPQSNRGKLIKAAAYLLPISMLDSFFLVVNRYQNRRK